MPLKPLPDFSKAFDSTKSANAYISVRQIFHFFHLNALDNTLVISEALPRFPFVLNLFLLLLLPDQIIELLPIEIFISRIGTTLIIARLTSSD